MTLPQTVIKGAIKVQGVPESACFDTFAQLLDSLGKYLTVEIATSAVSNVIISNVQPSALDKDKIWFRRSNSGSFVGIYVYTGTKWIQVLPAPQQVFWLYGDSSNPPDGFAFIQNGDGTFTAAEYAILISQAIHINLTSADYCYYPAKWTGV